MRQNTYYTLHIINLSLIIKMANRHFFGKKLG